MTSGLAVHMQLRQAAMAALKDRLPFASVLRSAKRRVVPYRDNPGNTKFCIDQGLEMLVALRNAGIGVEGAVVLEFGTGWLPLIPLILHMAGARHLILTDLERLMDDATVARARAAVADRLGEIATTLGLPEALLATRLHQTPFTPEYLVPWDAACHPAASVDVVVSRAALEHVPEPQIRFFLGEFRRILRPGGAMCHSIDLSDHWQHQDRSLSRIDFLRFDEDDWRWKLAQMAIQGFQNRLRHSEYQALMRQAGFEVLTAQGTPDPLCIQDLQGRVVPSRKFQGMAPDDLAVITALYVARRPEPAAATPR